MSNEQETFAAMKRAFDQQLFEEHAAGYTIVRSPLPHVPGCHSCGSSNVVDFSPMFERDASTMRSYMHVAVVCEACKADPEKLKVLGDRIVAHGQNLWDTYGDSVAVKTGKPAEKS